MRSQDSKPLIFVAVLAAIVFTTLGIMTSSEEKRDQRYTAEARSEMCFGYDRWVKRTHKADVSMETECSKK